MVCVFDEISCHFEAEPSVNSLQWWEVSTCDGPSKCLPFSAASISRRLRYWSFSNSCRRKPKFFWTVASLTIYSSCGLNQYRGWMLSCNEAGCKWTWRWTASSIWLGCVLSLDFDGWLRGNYREFWSHNAIRSDKGETKNPIVPRQYKDVYFLNPGDEV